MPEKTLSESNRRVLRTAYQILVALVTAIPLVLFALPSDVQAAPLVVAFGVWVGVVAKAINALEDAGILPAWLK